MPSPVSVRVLLAKPISNVAIRSPVAVSHRLTVFRVAVTSCLAPALRPMSCSNSLTATARTGLANTRSQTRVLSLCVARATANRPSALNQILSVSRSTGSEMSSPRWKSSTRPCESSCRFQPTSWPATPISSSRILMLHVPLIGSPSKSSSWLESIRISSCDDARSTPGSTSTARPDGAITLIRRSSTREWLKFSVNPIRRTTPSRSTMTRRTSGDTSSAVIVHSSRFCNPSLPSDHCNTWAVRISVSNMLPGLNTTTPRSSSGRLEISNG